MSPPGKFTVEVQGAAITILSGQQEDYIRLTDIARYKDSERTDYLIPPEVTPAQAAITYATEADLLNVALFGQTARPWRGANPKLDGNIRDYASVEQLLAPANMEGMNAEFIHMGLAQSERLKRFNQIAIRQMQTLTAASVKALPGGKERKE